MNITNSSQAVELGGAINHHFGGGVYAKEMIVPAGILVSKHKHDFTHLSVLAKGVASICVDGKNDILTAPACITIEAGKQHEIVAITDIVWYCIHATSCVDADEVDSILTEGK